MGSRLDWVTFPVGSGPFQKNDFDFFGPVVDWFRLSLTGHTDISFKGFLSGFQITARETLVGTQSRH